MYPNLKLQLWKTGIRQNRLAKLLDIDETRLSKIVNGFREPTPDMRMKIAVLLNSEQEWLFERASHAHASEPEPLVNNGEPEEGGLH